MSRINGRDLLLYIDNSLVALSKSCNIDITADLTEVASVLHGRAKTFRAGRYSWQVSSECLVASEDETRYTLLAELREGTKVKIMVKAPGSQTLSGEAFVQSLSISGAIGSMATYSVTLIGTGELETV